VYRNITFTAKEEAIERARARAIEERTSLNIVFRQWLESYARSDSLDEDYRRLMKHLEGVDAGRKFSREELNKR
jgi:hypothetical protein